MAAKMVQMTVAMVVLLSLATMPSPSAAARFDPVKLFEAIDIHTGKNERSNWCDSCDICTLSLPPICICSDLDLCSKCVCSITLGSDRKHECETLAPKFNSYCRIRETKTLASFF